MNKSPYSQTDMNRPPRMTVRSLSTLGLSLFLLAALPSAAQEAKVRVKVKGDLDAKPDEGIATARMVKGDPITVVALKTKGGVTVLGGVPQTELDWSLVSVDQAKLTVVKSDKPKIVWGEGPVALETIEYFGGQFRLLATKPDPENAKLLLLQQVLNGRSLTGKAASLVAEIPYDALGKGPEYYTSNVAIGLTTTISIDSTKLLIGMDPGTTRRSAGAPIWVRLFDRKMQTLWSGTLATDPAASQVEVLSRQVDKTGAVWFLVKNVTNPAPKTREDLGYNITLYKLDSTGQKSVVVDLPGKEFVQHASVDMRPDGSIFCTGIFSGPDPERNESLGVFFMPLEQGELKWGAAKKHLYEKRLVKKEERLQVDMHIVRSLPRNDKGVFIITEKAGTEVTMVSDLSGKKTAKTQWVNGPFHVMQLSGTGDLTWYKQVDRNFAYADARPAKAVAATCADVLYLFYNDVEANLENRKNKLLLEAVSNGKDLIQLEFKADGTDKGRVVLKDGFKQGYLDADQIWYMTPGLIGTLATPSFSKDKTYPLLIELSQDNKK